MGITVLYLTVYFLSYLSDTFLDPTILLIYGNLLMVLMLELLMAKLIIISKI